MLLFKYSRLRHLDSFLIRNSIAFPTATQLNDPYESSIENVLRYRRSPPPLPPMTITSSIARFHTGGLYENESAAEAAERRKHNDRMQESLSLLQKARDEVGVLSLTTDPANVAMWAHYAENHAGLCLGFNIRRSGLQPTLHDLSRMRDAWRNRPEMFRLLKVNYQGSMPSAAGKTGTEYVTHAYTTKHSDWSYEREHRILRPVARCCNDGPVPLTSIDPCSYVTLILGLRVSDEAAEKVLKLAKKSNFPHVARVSCDRSEYKLEFTTLHGSPPSDLSSGSPAMSQTKASRWAFWK